MSALSPRVSGLLDKADEDLRLADAFLDVSPEQAGRLAYMAAFHAAQAVLLATTGREPKTHSGHAALLASWSWPKQAWAQNWAALSPEHMKARTSPIIEPSTASIERALQMSSMARAKVGVFLRSRQT